MTTKPRSQRETFLAVPATALFLAWLAAWFICALSGPLAVALVLLAAAFSARAVLLRLRERGGRELASFGLLLLIVLALSSLLLPIWLRHPGLGGPSHSHFILNAGHIH